MLYLLLAFPLGIIYLVFLITGISLGAGLIITLLGIPILLATMHIWRRLGSFERKSAECTLGAKISHKKTKYGKNKNLWQKAIKPIKESYTWRSLAHLFVKFPIGILSFVVLVSLISITLSFIATPILFYLAKSGIMNVACNGGPCFLYKDIYVIIVGLAGIFLAFVSLHAFNGLARVSSKIAERLLVKKK